jgi:hypothetical protein
MDKKQTCALKRALIETGKIWGMLAGVFVAGLVCILIIGTIAAYCLEYLSSKLPILAEPIPPEYWTYAIIAFIVLVVLNALYKEIRREYNKNLKACEDKKRKLEG